jgi:hypothetical protein
MRAIHPGNQVHEPFPNLLGGNADLPKLVNQLHIDRHRLSFREAARPAEEVIRDCIASLPFAECQRRGLPFHFQPDEVFRATLHNNESAQYWIRGKKRMHVDNGSFSQPVNRRAGFEHDLQ